MIFLNKKIEVKSLTFKTDFAFVIIFQVEWNFIQYSFFNFSVTCSFWCTESLESEGIT